MSKENIYMYDEHTGFLQKLKMRDRRVKRLEALNEALARENRELREYLEQSRQHSNEYIKELEHDNELLRKGLIVDSVAYRLEHMKPMKAMRASV